MGTHARTSDNVKKITMSHIWTQHRSLRRQLYQWWYRQISRNIYAKTRHTAFWIPGTCTTASNGHSTQITCQGTKQKLDQNLQHVRRVLFLLESEPEDEPMPLDDVNLEDGNIFIPNDSLDWVEEPSPDRHLCIHLCIRTDVNILNRQSIQMT